MSIKWDWQMVDEDGPWMEQSSPVAGPPRRRVPRRLIIALALIPVLAVAAFAAYYAWTYHARLNEAVGPVQQVARAELQSVAINDKTSFMALQDTSDSAWLASQERNFGRLERAGMPEFGWRATGAAPQVGRVSLEPGGALVEVTYQFAVAQPLPGAPISVTVQVPEFYKPTPSGWVHALPGADFWGPERSQNGKHITVLYYQREADIVEPLIPRMDDLVAQLCNSLTCPSQQIAVVFENSLSSTRQGFFSRDQSSTLRLPSPYLLALPTDANSRDELYRALETRLAQMVVSQAFGRNLYMNRLASQAVVQWELARVGLAGPFIGEATKQTLMMELEAGVTQPLATLSLRSNSFRADLSDAAMMSLAFEFLDQTQGAGVVERLIPAMRNSATLGDAIRAALQVDPATFESAWQSYLLNVVEQQDQPRRGT
jgi:hypothetical protein